MKRLHDFEGFDPNDDTWPRELLKPSDYYMQPERRKARRGAWGNFRTWLRSAFHLDAIITTIATWLIVALIMLSSAMLAGCGSDIEDIDPIYSVSNKTIRAAQSWCFSRDDVEYFTVYENEPDVLVCQNGETSSNGLWLY